MVLDIWGLRGRLVLLLATMAVLQCLHRAILVGVRLGSKPCKLHLHVFNWRLVTASRRTLSLKQVYPHLSQMRYIVNVPIANCFEMLLDPN